MQVFTMAEAAVKDFMQQLLRGELFDIFEVRGIEINTITRFEISCVREKAQLPEAQQAAARSFCTWAEMRPYVLQIIKGGQKPRSLKIIFAYSRAESLFDNASALFLNMLYENNTVTFTTAVAQQIFVMDKVLDAQWEEWVRQFFATQHIAASVL